jgi:DNA-binding transcriptional MerR regulator
MAYTVKKLAELSGVSVRTLHFYDEIGLLAPAYVGEQGYRYYEEEQLLMLQQILFFRELNFELKEIQRILSQNDFDKVKALESHRQVLQQKKKRMQELTDTVDKTIKRIRGEKVMNDKEMYKGFTPEKQAEHETYLMNRYGDKAKLLIEQSKSNTKNWSEAKRHQMFAEWDGLCKELAALMAKQEAVDSKEVQAVVKMHYELIKQFWTPNHDTYIGLGESYLDLSWKEAFEKYDDEHPKLARYLADAIKVFAKRVFK